MRRAVLAVCLALAACGSGDDVAVSRAKPEGAKLCGSNALRGEPAPPIPGKVRGCGLTDGVRVKWVAGIELSQPATVDCATAKALEDWVTGDVKPNLSRRGGGLSELKVFASYTCRPRNNIVGAKISEHGRGKAVDIGGFVLADGTEITVLKGWSSKSEQPLLKRLQDEACTIFGTVLGPRSDRYHANHFHLDTADHRGRSFCR